MFFREPSVSGEPLNGGSCRTTSNLVNIFWYTVWIISQTDLLLLQIYTRNVFSNIVCTRRTARRGFPTCHVHGHVLLIQGLNFQGDWLTCYRDIQKNCFFENHQYPENRLTGGPVVPPLTWTCSPGTRIELSARQICCFTWFNTLNAVGVTGDRHSTWLLRCGGHRWPATRPIVKINN